MSLKLANGPQGGIPPDKEGQEIDLRIAHWCVFGPRQSGMYETVRELIQAENQIEGVLAGFIEVPGSSDHQMKINQIIEGGKVDGMFPNLRTQDWGWAQKWADIHVIHTTIPRQVGELKPKAYFSQGTPESCMTMDVERGIESFLPASDWINRCEASFVTSRRAFECWSPFDYTGEKLHLINKGIDLDWWVKSPTVQDIDGEPSVLYGEIWREMKTPFHLLYAVNEIFKTNPKVRLNVWGLNMARKFWEDMISHAQFHKFIGKRGLRDTVDYPSQWMSRGHVLVSPVIYGDVSRVGQESMACFPDGLVKTSQGEKPIEEIELGELVQTHTGALQRVTNLYKRLFRGKLIQVRTGDSLITPTPNHPILTSNGWINAGDIGSSVGLYCWSARRRRLSSSSDNETIKTLQSITSTQGWLTSKRIPRRGLNSRPNGGSVSKRRTHPYSTMAERNLRRISDAKAEASRTLLGAPWKEIRPELFDSNMAVSAYQKQNSYNYTRSMQETIAFMAECGGGTADLFRLGVVSSPISENLFNKLTIQSNAIESFLDSFRPTPILNVKEIGYTGFVYNLGVAQDHSYLVDGLIVHNCGCPVIGWDTDPYGDQHAFRYAKPFSIQDLAAKIMEVYGEVLDNPAEVAKRCRETALQYFDINETASSVVKVLRDVTNNQ